MWLSVDQKWTRARHRISQCLDLELPASGITRNKGLLCISHAVRGVSVVAADPVRAPRYQPRLVLRDAPSVPVKLPRPALFPSS